MMLAASNSIGRLVALANLDKNILSEHSLEQAVGDMVDLISVRVKDKSVEEVADSLVESLFELRINLLRRLEDKERKPDFYLALLQRHIVVNMQISPFSLLAQTISDVLLAYHHIVSSVIDKLPAKSDSVFEDIRNYKLEYDTFKIFSFHPLPQIKYLKNWIDASLYLETGIILAHLILTRQAQLSKERIKSELIPFLHNSIIRFGAYSIFTGFWSPPATDKTNLTNSMKILAATIELEHNLFVPSSKDDLYQLINS